MDIKITGLPREIFEKALNQAKEGRLHILERMSSTLSEPKGLSSHAPRIMSFKIPTDKIRDVIGPGGKVIKKIIADTGTKVNIDDDGTVSIVSTDSAGAEEAQKLVRSYTSDPVVGEIYLGTVKKIVDFGAFMKLNRVPKVYVTSQTSRMRGLKK